MAITYSAGTGTLITSHIFNETVISQTDQVGNNTVVVSDDITAAGNGQEGDGTNGIGNSFVGRLIIIDRGLSTEQRRMCIAEAASTGNTWLLTVHENWDTNPVATTDTIDIPYEPADIEDGTASGGIGFNSRTGLFELSNLLTIQANGGLQIMAGTALEVDDRGSNLGFINQSSGVLYMGYEAGGGFIKGGLVIMYNNVTGEQGFQAQSGSRGFVYDSLFWSQLVGMQFENADGSDMEYYGTKWLNQSDEIPLYDTKVRDCVIAGKGASTDIARIHNTDCVGLVVSDVQVVDSKVNTTVEPITLEGVLFANVPGFVDVRQNKTWNLIDPIWDVADYTDLTWTGTSTGNELNDRRSIKATVKEADGTLLQDALVNVYEDTQLADLVLELTTDADGFASDSFIYLKHATNSVTTTYGGHALQCGKWLYIPAVFAQVSTAKFNGDIVLAPDPNIVQTTQATALTDGSGITWSEPANPTELIAFTVGSGTLAVGMVLTFSPSGAVGTLRESASGDSTAGELYLDTRAATAIANGDTFSRTGGTAGTFSGTYTNDSKQPYTISINGNSKSQQTIYDYLAAKQNETTLSADGELIWEWCRDAQSQPFYATGSSFFTERSNGKGIFIYDRGAGTLDYLTDDAGNTWTPPATVTVEVEVLDDETGLAIATTGRVYIADTTTKTQIMAAATNGSGIASIPFTYTTDVPIVGWARELSLTGTDYVQKDFTGTITASGFSQTVRLTPIA